MAERNLMTPSSTSLNGLLGTGVIYKVPTFQRDYSWKLDNWIDLWEDIKVVLRNGADHYMGAVVVQKKGEKTFTVIDGQQRLTTLSIFTLAVLKNIQDLIDSEIEPEANKERILELRRIYLGQRDPGSLLYSSKLFLNENNDAFYQGYLLQLRAPNNERSLQSSDRLLWQAYKFFYETLKNHFGPNTTGEQLANFLSKTVGDKLMFIKIEVEDELSAYTLFETLNYRGVELTVTDLLKNYLFSLISEADLRVAKESWKKISIAIGADKFPIFLRHYWISMFPLVRQEQLFKIIRNEINTPEKVFDLLNKLESASVLYAALQDPYHQEWQGNRDRIKRIREFKLFGLKQHLPILLAAENKFETQEFDKLLKLISVVSFRYNVIGARQANIMEELYNSVAIKISSGEFTTTRQVFEGLRKIYVDDSDFRNDMITLTVYSYGRSKKLARYILFELENHIAGNSDRDFESDPGTIEHILPENAPDNWEEAFAPIIQDKYTYRLGNYTLLESSLNRDCGGRDFSEKKELYQQSQYTLSTRINAPEWTPSTLDSRQQQMANWATSCWRLPYAD